MKTFFLATLITLATILSGCSSSETKMAALTYQTRFVTVREQEKKGQAEADSITKAVWTAVTDIQKTNTKPIDFALYAGTYHDNWFRDVVLSQQGNKMIFQPVRSPKLVGEVLPYKDDMYIVKWHDRSFDADAFMTFTLDDKQKPVAIGMKAISPLTDFSFDFHDLNLQRVN